MNTFDKVRESNRIEGILKDPTPTEIAEHERFVALERITINELEHFVKIYQPNAVIRDRSGLDVSVGGHIPPRGGANVRILLDALLFEIAAERLDAWQAHVKYEALHPFTDGNGRSGRALWYWMMVGDGRANLGFLHAFYYQTLQRVAL